MNWLKRKIIKWAMRKDSEQMIGEGPMRKDDNMEYQNDTVRFHLTPAVGGRILKVMREGDNRKNTLGPSDNHTQLYVIPSGEDVGARVAKIINMELMK